MNTVHFFAFYPHNLPKITDFSPWSSTNPKNTKSLHFDGDGWGCSALIPVFRQPISLLQVRNQSSSDFHFRIFEILPLLLWWLTPVFMMIYSWFYDDLLLLLWWFTPAFMMIYPYFYDDLPLLLWCFTPAFRMLYSYF